MLYVRTCIACRVHLKAPNPFLAPGFQSPSPSLAAAPPAPSLVAGRRRTSRRSLGWRPSVNAHRPFGGLCHASSSSLHWLLAFSRIVEPRRSDALLPCSRKSTLRPSRSCGGAPTRLAPGRHLACAALRCGGRLSRRHALRFCKDAEASGSSRRLGPRPEKGPHTNRKLTEPSPCFFDLAFLTELL